MNDRHILIVSVWLRDNDVLAFEAFERLAASAMAEFGGRIERALRVSGAEPEGDEPFEIHIVSFPSEAAFLTYRQSAQARKLAEQRERVISKTVVLVANEVNAYA